MKTGQGRKGQLLLEAQAVILILLLPLFTGLSIWGKKEYNKALCSHESFFQARRQLVLTRNDVHHQTSCGGISEKVALRSLESLDQTHGSGISISDWIEEVSQLSEELFSFSRSLSESDLPP